MSERRPETEAELIAHVRAIDVPAPLEVHARVEALVAEHRRAAERPRGLRGLFARPVLAGSLAAAAVAVVILVVALAGGGGGSSSSVNDLHAASHLVLGGATQPAPAKSHSGRAQLSAQIEGVAFPYWEDHFGWRATGSRTDIVNGRPVRTVFYANDRGQRVGYAIVGGSPPVQLHGGTVVSINGHPYHLMSVGGVTTVAWWRSGLLCVVAGKGVDSATLLKLASWQGHGAEAA
jgi:hypothetical protein